MEGPACVKFRCQNLKRKDDNVLWNVVRDRFFSIYSGFILHKSFMDESTCWLLHLEDGSFENSLRYQ